MIERLKQVIGRDGSPGYTDHPRTDIRAHRANARWAMRLGSVVGGLGIVGFYATGDVVSALGGLTLAALSFWAATSLRLEALEWELKLEREDNDA